MVDTIYIEKSVLASLSSEPENEAKDGAIRALKNDLKNGLNSKAAFDSEPSSESKTRVQDILRRYPKAQRISVEKHTELFNRANQNFRHQKHNPSLILASKQNKRVHSTPTQYETGGGANYYFSHMLNCLYDCRYCFLQGMYRSANYLLFVNYEDFWSDIEAIAEEHANDDKPCWFFSGYDCDSLAFEPVTGFAEYFVPRFAGLTNSVLELRTKSTQIRSLLTMQAPENVVVAYSLNPANVVAELEIGAPSLQKRIDALSQLQQRGWRIGLRFDPIIWHEGYEQSYQDMLALVFAKLDANLIDSVTLGGFRLPKDYFKRMQKLYPDHWLFVAGLQEDNAMVTYQKSIESEILQTLSKLCEEYIESAKLFCYSSVDLM